MHGSLLPKYRGRAPVNWAILRGETETGATLHAMTSKPDAGEIVDQEPVPIGPNDTALEVQGRVTAAAVKVLARRVDELKAGSAPRRPQGDAAATTFPRRRPEDGSTLDRERAEVHNPCAPSRTFPGAFTDIPGGQTHIWKTALPQLGRTTIFLDRFAPSGAGSTWPAGTTGTWRSSASSGRGGGDGRIGFSSGGRDESLILESTASSGTR